MIRECLRRFGVIAYVAVTATGALAVTWKPEPLPAQVQTRCFLVVCTGNVCVWEEVACPKAT